MKIANNIKFLPRILSNKNRTPLYLIFFITSRCNMRCKHCFFWKEINKLNELSLKEIEIISKTVDPLLFLRLTGGEPFLRDDVPEIVNLFYKNASLRNLGINTNGFFTEKIINNVKRILSQCDIALEVCVSIDDLPKQHDDNRGVKLAFEHAIKTVRELNSLKENHTNLMTTIVLTVNSKNQGRLNQVFEIIKIAEPDFICANFIRGSSKEPKLKSINTRCYLDFVDLIKPYNSIHSHGLYLSKSVMDKVISSIIHKIFTTNKYQGMECVASDKIAVLYPNGDVCPCEILQNKIGNLKEFNFNFKRLWSSKKRYELKEDIIKRKCFCTHECFLSSSLLLNPKNLFLLFFRSIKSKFRKNVRMKERNSLKSEFLS